ncbi:glutathione S-transferase family protein [Lysobacter sp. KIS68-7]|uniref:glutathione S-transferase family protein n=1 Tax=Lysobacter sp. KIS68-7 TaxID=2904252 RepID=UPI001E652FD2|nr:glutathione S-transferase family protein [Lysobacter sp. KIS68-7]UHQ19214.1 glutathione S-transferase family protein [Lysobacter sp. KIS68-7]
MSDTVTVHGFSPSGNCHKVRLLLEQLGRPYRWVETRSDQGATRTPAFLALNPNAKVPVLVREDGAVLTESNAMLCWLAEGSAFLPADAWARAQALSWMFFEQYSHEPYVAVARFICGWTPLDSPRRADLPRLRERAHAALAVMERHLASHAWFTGEAYGIADIALFAYTAVADEGGVSLARYPAINDWLARVRGTPRFIGLPDNDADVRARLAASA